jgi:hypothetical protein
MELPADVWFAPQYAVLFAFASLTSLLAALEPYAQRGEHILLVLGACATVLLAAVAALVAAAVGHNTGQPPYVIGTLAVAGGIVTLATTVGLARFIWLYRQASVSGRPSTQD